MNRSLLIPAGCSLVLFAALLAALHGAGGREVTTQPAQSDALSSQEDRRTKPFTHAYPTPEAPGTNGDRMLSTEEAEQALTRLAGEYLRPWRQWEASSHRLYSRAAPRPIPATSAKVELSQGSSSRCDSFLVAIITVTKGAQSQQVPCVVDCFTKEVQLFAGGQWLSEDEWLKKAPLPHSAKP